MALLRALPHRHRLIPASALLATAYLLARPAAAAVPPSPDEHPLQWPLGQCVEDRLVAGHLYDVQQDFDQHNTGVGRCRSSDTEPLPEEGEVRDLQCRHAGFDLHRSDAPAQTYDDPVLAMADGTVVDLIDWNAEGVGVLVRHDNGLFAHYVHLRKEAEVVHVRRGQRVRAGQPLGRVMSYPYGTNNDHLHLELRSDQWVTSCPSGNCAAETSFSPSCRGNGYALAAAGSDLGTLTATNFGFIDPTRAYFEHRPSFPATIAVERGPLDVYESPDVGSAVLGQLAADALSMSSEDPQLVGDHGWYQVTVGTAEGEGEATVSGYARGFTDLGFGGDIAIGEVPTIGRHFILPPEEPLVDLRFGASARTTNWGTGADATVEGTLSTAPPYPEALPEDFCDHVGQLDASSHLEVALADGSFVDGVALDLDLRLDAFEDGGTIAMSGDPEAPTWRLAVRVEDERRRLVFEVTTEAGDLESIATDLPQPRCKSGAVPPSACNQEAWNPETADCPATTACDPAQGMPAHCFEDFGYRQWRHVAARYDVGTNTFELLWDGMSVEQRSASTTLLDAEDRTIRIGEGLAAALDDVRVWVVTADEDDDDDKNDGLHDWGDTSRGANEGCACTSGSGSGGSGAASLLLLALWALRRRRGIAAR